MMREKISESNIGRICELLGARDDDLARATETCGVPPLWKRDPDFSTLVRIILEQQVSLASARAAFDKLTLIVGAVSPGSLLALTDREMKEVGFSARKSGYARELADALLAGRLQLASLGLLNDTEARAELMKVRGIGAWSADIYLLMAERRPDIFPPNDLALLAAFRQLKGLGAGPAKTEMDERADSWRPYRSVAARILWHFYLSEKTRRQR